MRCLNALFPYSAAIDAQRKADWIESAEAGLLLSWPNLVGSVFYHPEPYLLAAATDKTEPDSCGVVSRI